MNNAKTQPHAQLPAQLLHFGRLHLFLLFALLAIAAVAWTESGHHVQQQLTEAVSAARDSAEHDAADISLGLQRNITLLHGIPATFAQNQQVSVTLQTRVPLLQSKAQSALSQFLESAVADLNAVSVLWVMDPQGNCIAASNVKKTESFVGTRYADRDYFKKSMMGLNGSQFAIGKNTGVAGLFFSAPVLRDGKVVGVVAAKVDLPFLSLWLSQANAFVTDEYGVVILATDPLLNLRAFDSALARAMSTEQSMQRYRLQRVPAVVIRNNARPGIADLLLVDRQPTPAVHTEHSIGEDNRLVVHVLGPVPYALDMEANRIARFALETGFGALVLLLISMAVFYVRQIQRAHATLEVHKSRLDEAQLLAQVGSWELSLATGTMQWSDQVHRIFQIDASDESPTLSMFLERIQEADRPALREILENASGSLERIECLVGIVRGDGDVGRARLQLQAVVGKGGEVEGFLGTLRDTTEQELLESELRMAKIEAESANSLKSEFLANVSHELRTPMNTILGMSHIALQGDLSAPHKTQIQAVHRSAEHLLFLINEILDFSRIEAGKYTFERKEFPLREVTRKLKDRLEPLAVEKGLEFQLDLPSNLPARLIGDPEQLGKVLNALVMNSIKFTQDGRVSVGIEMNVQTNAMIELHLWVNDTGVGMTAAQQSNLFQAFRQGDGSRTRKFGGTGLGLVISQRIVDMMGGRMWVQSTFGKGTTVHFTVPFEQAAQGQDVDLLTLRFDEAAQPLVTDTETDSDTLPPLPGIDTQVGLNVAMSDRHLYKKLLIMFAQSEADFAGKFDAAWKAGDAAQATRLAHSLKGVAGSIGAKDVQAAALLLESACHKGLVDAEIQPLLTQTLQALQWVIGGLSALSERSVGSDETRLDTQRVMALAGQLAGLLAQQDLSAFDLAEELAEAVRGSEFSAQINLVIKAIDRFDLNAAQEELKRVSAALEGR